MKTVARSSRNLFEDEPSLLNHNTTIARSLNTSVAFCYTDGSALGNPGRCGAGACILLPDHDLILVFHWGKALIMLGSLLLYLSAFGGSMPCLIFFF